MLGRMQGNKHNGVQYPPFYLPQQPCLWMLNIALKDVHIDILCVFFHGGKYCKERLLRRGAVEINII